MNDGVKMVRYYVAFAFAAALSLTFIVIRRVISGTSAARERARRKQESSGTTTDREVNVVLTPWHSHLVASGYMPDIFVPMRTGDIVRGISDDPDKAWNDEYDYLFPTPFIAPENGTLVLHIGDLKKGQVDYEWRRLRA